MQHSKSTIAQIVYKEWQIMLGQHIVLVTLYCGWQSVARQLELVTLHEILSVVFFDTKLCIVFSVKYIVFEGPKLDA